MRDARDRHERAVRCGGREWRTRRRRRKRTAKSCGPDAAVLASSSREARLSRATVAKEPLTGERGISRKTIARGRPDAPADTCMLVCALLCAHCTRDRRCGAHPVFPAPSDKRAGSYQQNSGARLREIAKSYPRHCERSEAIHYHLIHGKMDCFAALPMTTWTQP